MCTLPRVVGPCSGSLRQYYYDIQLGRCLEFDYSGCQGNDNKFNSLRECAQRCGGPAEEPRQPEWRPEAETQPPWEPEWEPEPTPQPEPTPEPEREPTPEPEPEPQPEWKEDDEEVPPSAEGGRACRLGLGCVESMFLLFDE